MMPSIAYSDVPMSLRIELRILFGSNNGVCFWNMGLLRSNDRSVSKRATVVARLD